MMPTLLFALACSRATTPDAPMPSSVPPIPHMWINELMALNESAWRANDGSFPDWVELWNGCTGAIDLGRVTLEDSSGEAWRGAPGRVLEAGGRVLIVADGTGIDGHAPFEISSATDRLILRAAGVEMDRVDVVGLGADLAWASAPDGGFRVSTGRSTPGEPNLAAPGRANDASDVLFGDDEVQSFAIEVSPGDEPALNVKDGPGVPGTLTFEGIDFEVTVRLKGGGSFEPLEGKPAFSIDLNDRVPDQRLRGLEQITLNNGLHDPTFVRESLAYEVFAAAGIPAPRVGWASVTYNGADFGLYVHVESVDDRFLHRWYADSSGMLLEGSRGGDFGGDTSLLELDEGSRDEVFLTELAAVLADWDAAEPGTGLDALVDLDAFTTYAAVEAVTMHWDGYQLPNNYYAWLDPRTGRLGFLPHGTDWTWMLERQIYNGEGDVFQMCLAMDSCRNQYLDALLVVSDMVDALDLESTFNARSAWLAPVIAADTRDRTSDDEVERNLVGTLENLRTRTSFVRLGVEQVR